MTLEERRSRLTAERDEWEIVQTRLDEIAERCETVRRRISIRSTTRESAICSMPST